MSQVLAFDDIKPDQVRRPAPGPGSPDSTIYQYFKASPEQPNSPNVTFARYEPGVTSSAHFHTVDQFQILVEGKGRFGRHDVSPYYVHFARAYTPYGPLLSDQKTGWSFMTLRTHYDPGAQRLPGARDKLKQIRGRRPWQITENITFPSPGPGVSLQEIPQIKNDHGLFTCSLTMAAGTRTVAPEPAGGDGQYIVVTSGSLSYNNAEHKPLAVVFIKPDEKAFEIHAGAQGLQAIIMNFPQVLPHPSEVKAPAAVAGAKIWHCALCAFDYDEAQGLPPEGIAPGTPWKDVPETWTCPDCGTGKSDFEMLKF